MTIAPLAEIGSGPLPGTGLDPITLSVMDSGLRTAVAEMKSVVLRTAYSNLWREAGDLSCGLLDAHGDIVAQGVGDIPIHLASMPTSMRGLLARIPAETLEPGDVLLQNDPYQGNNHMPDFIMAKPIFSEDRLIAFAAVRGHYVDIGGPTPGSYNLRATDLYGEGLRMPPVKLYRRGELNEEIVSIISLNVRNSAERLGDMRSQYAGCLAAERRLLDYCERYGTEVVEQAMREVLDVSERRARTAFREMPDGRYEFADTVDGDGFSDEPVEIRVALTIDGDEVEVDFTGTSPQARGGINSPLAVTLSATYFALKAVAEPHTSSNSGSYRPVTIVTPEGTVINPHAPAPVVAGNHETSARIADVVLGALSQAVPGRVCAAGTGSSTVLIIGRDGVVDDSIMYEVHGAGQGANIGVDGSHARRTSIGNTGNTPVEVLEGNHPIRVIGYEIRQDGGGAGRYRGGNGITRIVEFTEESTVTIVADRDRSHPYGLAGGHQGETASFVLTLPDGTEERLGGKTVRSGVPAGAVLRLTCAGAGGYGDPSLRPPAEVQADLDDGYLSPERARASYGVDVVEDESRVEGRYLIATGAER
ncbi:hydantoinase B/oxoprolinase family protein [Leucobacter allii]|uniref:Hydantoinase B/oxoprolinase family protein n=1 Tax=Leucobacter allii TaxID=2932247 RepID=A0ABY4FJ83_9MICO|nr:hydantoinase B/oxoprolinase family protein [Leucobacter allii]UOQ56450.1 hydantoinase B/oxoprolinase family protein [Leucobacter allii]UOR00884.1 hydantoinase B/oxoprolinase family protein [Leucobacter allii]